MPALSFRIKLLLAMMAVVAGGTLATILVTQKNVQAAYQDLFDRQFESQAFFFSQLQDVRLSAAKEKCIKFVKSPRLVSWMLEYADDPVPEIALNLYQTATDELVIRLGTDVSQVTLRFIDKAGKQISPRQTGQKSSDVAGVEAEKTPGFMTNVLHSAEGQQIAYLESEDQSEKLQEAVFTRIIDIERDETVGALIVGFEMPDLSTLDRRTRTTTALLLAGKLHPATVPEEARKSIVEEVMRQTSVKRGSPEPLKTSIADVPHLLFYRRLNPGSAFPPAYQVTLFSLADSLAQQRNLRWKILASGTLLLFGSLMVSLLLSHGLTAPINDLVKGTAEIAAGNFEVNLKVRSRDEIGRLTRSFNEMTVGLALKEKYRSVLDKVADRGIAEKLLQGKITLGGETRVVSVLFCDIRGFTALTEKMKPPEVIQLLNEHFTPLTKVVYEHHGVVDKYVGDLIMAIFGAPESFGNDALNAAQCALRMIEERDKLNETSQYSIAVGIGVATGEAVAGCMGSIDRLNYSVLGERVNLASRLCSKAGRMEIVIDQTTRDRLGTSAGAEPLEPLVLKGFAEPVQAFKLKVNQT